jgi:hypothetical protein
MLHALVLCAADLAPPLGHLSVSSFYGFAPDAQHDFLNLELYGPNINTVQSQIDAFAKYGLPSLYGLDSSPYEIFNRSVGPPGSGAQLYPIWEAEVERLTTDILPHFGPAAAYRGVFLGDELCCYDTACYSAVLSPVASKLRDVLGPGAILATNECVIHSEPVGGYPEIPAALDLFAVDSYAGYLPGSRGRDEAAQARAVLERQVYPKLRPHQRVLLIPGAFGCANLSRAGVSLAVQSENLVEKLEAYWEWAQADERVAGFAPWHFSYRATDQSRESPCDMQLGVSNFSDALAAAQSIGRAIVGGGAVTRWASDPPPQKLLFVDAAPVANLSGDIGFVSHTPTPAGIALRPDQPWETFGTIGYHSVVQAGAEDFRMYYDTGWTIPDGTDFHRYTCLATSKDGVTWIKPVLGVSTFNGSTANNIVWPRDGADNTHAAGTVFIDTSPAAPADAKWKMVAQWNIGGVHPRSMSDAGVYLMQSADGIAFEPMFSNRSLDWSDTKNVMCVRRDSNSQSPDPAQPPC